VAAGFVAIPVARSHAVGTAVAAEKLSPPVIREHFRPLPCPDAKNPRTTVGMIGCAERVTVRADRKINGIAKVVFALLRGDAARRHFIKAQRAWLTYRNADCASVSDKYEGGTLARVVAADCTARRTAQHLKETSAFERLLQSEG